VERLNREIKRRTRVVGTFPDGESALMLVAARLRYVAGTTWGLRRYLNMTLLRPESREPGEEVACRRATAARPLPVAGPQSPAGCSRSCLEEMCETNWTVPTGTGSRCAALAPTGLTSLPP
jgi:hypothetical protein